MIESVHKKYIDLLSSRPNMERISEEVRIFERPSAVNSIAMQKYIYGLESIIVDLLCSAMQKEAIIKVGGEKEYSTDYNILKTMIDMIPEEEIAFLKSKIENTSKI